MKVSFKCLISSRLFKYFPNKFVCFSQVGIKMAPVDNSLSSPLNSHFQLISSLKANNLIPVHKYKSKLTNLQVVIAEVEGPLVDGHFCLATEAYDDDGLPHTLEHLIFLGSEDYPYKGVLDLLANRCLASGTNAWTDTDHTCYTVRTAGSDGFLTLLPIYLDHILYPTLTDSGYITEVHHINEEGNDAGVVYSEMQGVENTGESLCHLMMIRSIYPGKCGYKSETGGLLKNLRESTNNEKVRNFHKEFYRSDNLTLIITGQVKPEHVFAALQPFEEKILAKGNRGDFIRPWQSPVPPFTESINTEVLYPCDEEDNGMVYIGWRGPSSVTELYQMSACSILLKYLTDNSVSPLQKEFVETEDPHCSKVSYSLIENSETILYLMFENVPTGKLCEIKDRLDIVLNRITSGAEPLDIKRMRTVLHRHKLEALIHLENSPHETITYMVIGDMLYGNTSTDLNQRLNLVEDLRKMEIESQDFWVGLLKKYLVDGPSVTLRGRPSKDGEKKMVQDELARIEAQRQKLGEAGLFKCAEDLSKATRHNETPPPDEMLTCVPIPSMESINFYPIGSFTTYSEKQHPKFNLKNVPVQMHLDDVHSNFIYLYVLLDTSKIDPALRPYLPLLLESLLELPVQRGESLIPYEEIVAELENDTITAETRLGLDSSARFSCGPYAQTACLGLQLEPSKYERCVEWIRELLYQTRFTVERIRVVAAKIANDVAQAKRQGYKVVWDLMKGILYNKESNFYVTSMLRQHRLLTAVLSQLDKPDTAGKVLSDLESLRRSITVPGNICIHMAADLNKLTEHSAEPALIWKKILTPAHEPLQQTLHVVPDWNFRQPEVEILPSCLVGLGCLESSFLCQTCTSMKDFNHPDLPALLVFLQYLTQLEGPMWRQIRGLGLAYGFTMCPKPNEGILFLTLYRAANCVAAYKEARNIVETQMNEDARWEQTLFDSAKSSIIFEIIEREKSVGDVVNHSLLSYFKGVSHDYNRELVRRVSATTVEDVKRVGPLYVKPLFNSKIAKTTIVTNPAKSEEIVKGFSEFGINLEVLPSLENCFLSEW